MENITIKKVSVHTRRHPKMQYVTTHNGGSKALLRDYNKDMNEYNEPTRVYVNPSNYSIMENFLNRTNRPWKLWKPLVEKELKDAGVQGKVRWSQYAGCKMCPCSPGFVLEDAIRDDGRPIDVYITVDLSA